MRATRVIAAARAVRHTLLAPSALVRVRGSPGALQDKDDFAIYPGFYSLDESRELLGLALWKLNRVDMERRRGGRRRRDDQKQGVETDLDSDNDRQEPQAPLQDMFTGSYGFEEGHFDSVIHQYRESLITSLPPTSSGLAAVLARLYGLVPSLAAGTLPPPGSSTHALHLSPDGAILPHVDNVEASGQTIVGASLGASRILRLENSSGDGWDVLLPSGSVYIQKGCVRYDYKHSILAYSESSWDGAPLVPGHRVSFMVRDAK